LQVGRTGRPIRGDDHLMASRAPAVVR